MIDKLIIPFVLTLITSFISYIVTLLSKEQKISEFRQEWIDCLRNDLSEFAGQVKVCAHELNVAKSSVSYQMPESGKAVVSYFKENPDELLKTEQLYVRIILRLNLKEDPHIKLKKSLDNIIGKIREFDEHAINYENFLRDFMLYSQDILKKEWKRVKRGERIFYCTKWGAFLLLVVCIVIIAFYYQDIWVYLKKD